MAAKAHRHQKYNATPMAMTGTAYQAAGAGGAPCRVRISEGTSAPPAPGTTMVNKRLRMMRLSARAMARQSVPGVAVPAAAASESPLMLGLTAQSSGAYGGWGAVATTTVRSARSRRPVATP